ncbi:MAG: ribonuclease HII [Anaerolineales bacterium]
MKKLLHLPLAPHLFFESRLWKNGIYHVAGIDEAGRGALAGPVAAAAVIFPTNEDLSKQLDGVRDSKQMTAEERTKWAPLIKSCASSWAVGFASHQEIDEFGILHATRLAIKRALESLYIPPDHLLIDFLTLPEIPYPQTSLVKGDCRSLSIAAASVLAKTSRDQLMREYAEKYPEFGFAEHKGYATRLHLERIEHFGPCPIHRRTFAPINQHA